MYNVPEIPTWMMMVVTFLVTTAFSWSAAIVKGNSDWWIIRRER